MVDMLGSVIPIVALVGLGIVLRRTRVLDDCAVDGLKRLVVSAILPAVLFTAFLGIEFRGEYVAVVLLVLTLCVFLLGVGHLVRRPLGGSGVIPFLFTGFEFGMVGLALFTAAFGVSELPVAGMVGLGHEFFIWFIFVTLLRRRMAGRVSVAATMRSFATSPVILAIAAGLVLNLLGGSRWLEGNVIGAAFLQLVGYLAAMIVPVILIVVGHGTRLTRAGVRQAAPLVAARFALMLALALLVNHLVIRTWLGLPPIVEAAVFTLLILPPPFIVPIYLPRERRDEITLANNVLSLHTVISVAAFVVYVAVTG
ncbi:hypothetical protein LKO27_01530 [Tessaracoccus sp. OS52]|uniref:AEC family transporter n=1 Tax=Tessaracoccus sp. OS52 TaxID=2886691 RepID=UPI001D10627A|nr:hypothetical protein [Tessaracoccus sp. OS52]MCC2592110.1 hypothetical protein [Tessaracoccus sp. OS52]